MAGQETLTSDELLRQLGRTPHKPQPLIKPQQVRERLAPDYAIHFVVPQAPVGKPRMTQKDKWAQRPCVIRYRQWADALRSVAGPMPAPETVQRLDWKATFAMPKSWSKAKRDKFRGMPHRSKPDRDNIDKAILDPLFFRDEGIASGFINKVWGDESSLEVWITLESEVAK